MMNRSLAVISSPFQLFCLNELIKQKEIVNVEVLLLYNKQSYKAYQEALDLFEIKGVKMILRKRFITRLQLLLFSLLSRKCKYLIIGNFMDNYQRLFLKRMTFEKSYILDDGTESIVKFKNKYLDELAVKSKSQFELFTMFKVIKNLKYHITINELLFFKKEIETKHTNDEIYIIGQPLVELNVISKNQYCIFIENILKINSGSKIKYFPHRLENTNYLKDIFKTYDVETFIMKSFFEIFLIKNKYLPKRIIGFYSTALISVAYSLPKSSKLEIEYHYLKEFNSNEYVKKIMDYFVNIPSLIGKLY
jgi:hypothetical protein